MLLMAPQKARNKQTLVKGHASPDQAPSPAAHLPLWRDQPINNSLSHPMMPCVHVRPGVQIDRSGWVACGGGVNRLQPELTHAAGWALEACLTFLLVFTVLAATDSERATDTAHLPVSPHAFPGSGFSELRVGVTDPGLTQVCRNRLTLVQSRRCCMVAGTACSCVGCTGAGAHGDWYGSLRVPPRGDPSGWLQVRKQHISCRMRALSGRLCTPCWQHLTWHPARLRHGASGQTHPCGLNRCECAAQCQSGALVRRRSRRERLAQPCALPPQREWGRCLSAVAAYAHSLPGLHDVSTVCMPSPAWNIQCCVLTSSGSSGWDPCAAASWQGWCTSCCSAPATQRRAPWLLHGRAVEVYYVMPSACCMLQEAEGAAHAGHLLAKAV